MSDQNVRALERRWNETGAVEDEAAYLQARVRAGELSQERLDVASWVGYAAARLARPQPPLEPEAWIAGVEQRGPDVVKRVAFAAAWARAPRWLLSAAKDGQRTQDLRQYLEACASFLVEPNAAGRASLEARAAAWGTGAAHENTLFGLTRLLLGTATDLHRILGEHDPLVLREVGQDVGAWALGLEDPVVSRVDPLDELRERRGEFGAPDAALLSLRTRAGDLLPGALGVLHLLRYPEALELLGETEDSLGEIAERVSEQGPTRLLQLALIGAQDCCASWESRNPEDSTYQEGLAMLLGCCQETGPAQIRSVGDWVEATRDHADPPWALLRAGMVVRSSAPRAARGALAWAVSERIVAEHGDFDYDLVRSVSRDSLDRLDPEVRERLGLSGSETIFAAPAAMGVLPKLTETFVPLCLRSKNARVRGLGEDVVEVVPVPRRWEDFVALGAARGADELVQRVTSKDLKLKNVRAAATLGSALAETVLTQLNAAAQPPPEDPQSWCDVIWACGTQAWGYAVLAYLEEAITDDPLQAWGLGRWPARVRAWLAGDPNAWAELKSNARYHLNGSGLRYGQPIDDCDYAPAHPDDARALAVLSLSRRRGLRYQRAAKAIGAPAMRERVAGEAIPAVLGYTRFPNSACPAGTPVAAYDPASTFAVGTWIHHSAHGLGEVVAAASAHVDVQFDRGGRRRLAVSQTP
jgi:hypothetical protein